MSSKIKSITFKGVEYKLNEGLTVIVDNSDNRCSLVDYMLYVIHKHYPDEHLNAISKIITNKKILIEQTDIKKFLRKSFSRNKIKLKREEINHKDSLIIEKSAESYYDNQSRQTVVSTTLPLFVGSCKPEDILIVKKDRSIGYASEFGIHTYGCEINDIISNVFESCIRNTKVSELIAEVFDRFEKKDLSKESIEKFELLCKYLGKTDPVIIHLIQMYSIIQSQ
jgi:hypothetical protein